MIKWNEMKKKIETKNHFLKKKIIYCFFSFSFIRTIVIFLSFFLRFQRFNSFKMTLSHYIHYKKLFTSIINILNCDSIFFCQNKFWKHNSQKKKFCYVVMQIKKHNLQNIMRFFSNFEKCIIINDWWNEFR